MKEVTRIHVAKHVYDIELTAKKQLEAYIASIAAVLHDDETMQDIEQRMSEILAEQGVSVGGVITEKDVNAIKEQLGSSADFKEMSDDRTLDSEANVQPEVTTKRLMRDPDNRIIGGVASGISKYFNIDAIWIRLLFVLLFFSGGFGILLYIILWIAMPLARTNIDRLAMQGKPINLETIKEQGQLKEGPSASSSIVSHILRAIVGLIGVGLIIMASMPLLFALSATVFTLASYSVTLFPTTIFDWLFFIAGWIALIGMSTIGIVLGIALLRLGWFRKPLKNLKLPFIAGLSLLLIAGFSATTLAPSTIDAYRARIAENYKATPVVLPQDIHNIKALKLGGTDPHLQVEYVVDAEKTHAELRSWQGQAASYDLEVKNNTLQINSKANKKENCFMWSCDWHMRDDQLIIYGPALDKLVITAGSVVYRSEGIAQSLAVDSAGEKSALKLEGTLKVLTVRAEKGTFIQAEHASIERANIELFDAGTSVTLGRITSLTLTLDQTCGRSPRLSYSLKGNGNITVNDRQVSPRELEDMDCIRVSNSRYDRTWYN